MKYFISQKFDYPLSALLQARGDRYKYLDKFPELKNVTLLEERIDKNLIHQKRKIDLAKSMPPIVSDWLSDAALIEESIFDSDTNVHTFKLFPPEKEKVVTITGKSTYRALDESTSERSYEVDVKSMIFLVGGIIEAAIEEIHKQSLEKDKASILNFLKEYKITEQS